jgi:hypothetical protein
MRQLARTKFQRAVWVCLLALIVVCLVVAVRSKVTWNKYLVEHHCREAGHQDAGVWRTTIYTCDGGETLVLHDR